jgi:hypothetical protein
MARYLQIVVHHLGGRERSTLTASQGLKSSITSNPIFQAGNVGSIPRTAHLLCAAQIALSFVIGAGAQIFRFSLGMSWATMLSALRPLATSICSFVRPASARSLSLRDETELYDWVFPEVKL